MLTYKIIKKSTFFKVGVFFVLMVFMGTTVVPPSAFANTGLLGLPSPGVMVPLSPGFAPAILRGIKIYPNNPLKFDFILDSGDTGLTGKELKPESEKLIKYFLASLTIPENNLWVNLSPYEKDLIIPNNFGSTEMGRDMLAQDYLLKQVTASLISPEDELGKKFWDTIYKKVYEQYGITDIPVDTFHKVWIVPQKAVVYENGDRAFVVESSLRVMLEQDYLASNEQRAANRIIGKNLNTSRFTEDVSNPSDTATSVMREIIIPELEREINEGKNFAPLRQIYSSLILAYWFKKNLKETILNQVYADKSKVKGVDVEDREISKKIYNRYLEAFKKGVCDIIRVEHDGYTQRNTPRKYFSGGFNMDISENSDYTEVDALSHEQQGDAISSAAKNRFSFIKSEITQFLSRGQAVNSNLNIEVMTDKDKISGNDFFIEKDGLAGEIPSGLIGKVYSTFYTQKGFPLLEGDILIEEYGNNKIGITLKNGVKIYDKEGIGINFIEFGDKVSDIAKKIYVRDIKDNIKIRKLTGMDLEIATAIARYSERQDIYLLKENSYNIKGLHNIEKNRVYLDQNILSSIGFFHESGEGFLRTKEGKKFAKILKEKGISIHRYLRGAGSDERKKFSVTFYQGLQDKVFGSVPNQIFTNIVRGISSLEEGKEIFNLKGRKGKEDDEEDSIDFKVSRKNKRILEDIKALRNKLDKASPHGVRSRITFEIAEKYFDMKKYEKSISLARRAIAIGMAPGHDSMPVSLVIRMQDFIRMSERILKEEAELLRKNFPFSIPNANDIFAIRRTFDLIEDGKKTKLFSYFYEIGKKLLSKDVLAANLKEYLSEEQKFFLNEMYVDLEHVVVTLEDEVYIPFRFGCAIRISLEEKDGDRETAINNFEREPYALVAMLFEDFLDIFRKNNPNVKVVLDFGAGEGEKTSSFYDYEYGEKGAYIIANDIQGDLIREGLKKNSGITFIKQNLGETSFYAGGNYDQPEEVLFDHITFLSLSETSDYDERNILDYINRCRWSLSKGGKIDVITDNKKVVEILKQWDFREKEDSRGKRYDYIVDIPLEEKDYYQVLNNINTDFTWKNLRNAVGSLLKNDLKDEYPKLVKESVDLEFPLKNIYFEQDFNLNFYQINIVRIKAFIREKLGLPAPPVLLLKLGKDNEAYILRGRHKVYMEAKRGRDAVPAFIIDLGSDQLKFENYPKIRDLYLRYSLGNPNIVNSTEGETHSPKIIYGGRDTGSATAYDYAWTRYAEVLNKEKETERSSKDSLESLAKDLEDFILELVRSFNLSEVREMLEGRGDILTRLKKESRGNRDVELLSSIRRDKIGTDIVLISPESFRAIRDAIGLGMRGMETIDFPSEGFSIAIEKHTSISGGNSPTKPKSSIDGRAGSPSIQKPGGIDFDADGFEVETKGEGVAFNIPEIDAATLSQAEGFVPVIINIIPITNFNMLMGLNEGEGAEDEALSLTRLGEATVRKQ
ncbi:MAG: hypothetical protein P9M07_03735 [Candidatus Aceula meridiana]|nr:hypothetical protein [Candidatus Aceula meridiana]